MSDKPVYEILRCQAGMIRTLLAACPADGGTGLKARKLGTICALLAATPWLLGCETSRGDTPNPQFLKQVQRAQECRQLQDKLVGDQPLTPERAAEITKTMNPTGCAARLSAQ